ncbi:3-deoxy-manno-octulosonate cytidylyltransferase [bacterium]|nr:3-deoxy-manno-octulosonate cytidylyltransferase [bacterium]
MKIVVGIPARMGSTRFPGKPLCSIIDKPMIEHCYKRCSLSKYATNLFVAACDNEVRQVVEGFGGNVILTDPDIQRPGLRVATAAESLNLDDDDIVVVVQGDEPLVHPDMIDLSIQPLLEEKDIFVSNLAAELSEQEWKDPGEIKVVCDLNMNAMYMSRAPMPSIDHEEKRTKWWKQVCIMPFRWHFMKRFNHELAPTPLELQESIEMLRAIQHGYKVRMVPSPYISKSVDTDEDRKIAESLMKNDEIYKIYGKN